MKSCEWAGCSNPGKHAADSWVFCRMHLRAHVAFVQDGDVETTARIVTTKRHRTTPMPIRDRIAQVGALVEAGKTKAQIVEELGLTRHYLNSIMREGGMVATSCGSRTGYNRHRALGEPVCTPCRKVQREYDAARHIMRRAAA